jgi:hypothetical protein
LRIRERFLTKNIMDLEILNSYIFYKIQSLNLKTICYYIVTQKKKKPSTTMSQKAFLVAGEGLEPTTFGL